MAHSSGPFTAEELPDTAERDLGLTHMICAPCQIPEEQGKPVAVAFTFSADDAILCGSVLDLLEALEALLIDCSDPNRFHLVSLPVITQVHAAIRRARTVAP